MPYSDNSKLPSGVKDNLPEAAQTVYRKSFNSALSGTCKGDEECAAKVAWSAVKRGWKKEGDKWVKKSLEVVGLSFRITKASLDPITGERRWAATCSNTKEDFYKTFMSVDLFKDFIRRIDAGEYPPSEFTSKSWSGGKPYLSIAHYMDLDGFAKGGDTKELYVDGEYLKAKGVFSDTPVGRASYEAVVRDLKEKPENPIRISIGFLDYGHKHGNIEWIRKGDYDSCPLCEADAGPKIYTRGILIHLAMTRIPANPDTSIGLEERSMDGDIVTRKDDATSIVGEELAEAMEEKSKLIGLSQAKPVAEVVIRAEDEKPEEAVEVAPEEASQPAEEVAPAGDAPLVEEPAPEVEEPASIEAESVATKSVKDSLDQAYEQLRSVMTDIYNDPQSPDQESKLRELQPHFETFGKSVQEFMTVPSPEPVSADAEKLAQVLTKLLEPIVKDLSDVKSELRAVKSLAGPVPVIKSSSEVPERRSFQPPVNAGPPILRRDIMKPRSVKELVRESMGLS